MNAAKFESFCGMLGICSATTVSIGSIMGWLSLNATLVGIAIAFVGLILQGIVTIYNMLLKREANKREEDEHKIKMDILRNQYSMCYIQKKESHE